MTPLVTLLACAAPEAEVDYEALLLDLGTEMSTDLYRALHFTVGDERLAAMDDGDRLSDTYDLPADADPAYWETDGAFAAGWTVWRRTESGDDDGWPHFWDWEIDLTIHSLVLPTATVTGSGTWTIIRELYDYDVSTVRYDGVVVVDGNTFPCSWESLGTFDTMNTLDGTLGGTAVEWANPAPDEP